MLESSVPDSSAERPQARLLAFLLQLSDALRLLADTAAIEQTSLQLLRTHLGVPRALYAEVLGQDGTLRVLAESVESGLTPMDGQVLRFADFTSDPLMGRPVWRDDVLQGDHGPKQQAGHTALGTRAWAMVPLVKDGQFVAALTVHASEIRHWTPEDITVIQETAERTWAAVERARAETALRESEEKYRTLFTETDEAYSVVEVSADAAGHWNDFLFTEVNPAFMRHTGMPYPVGRTATELLGTPNPRWAQLYGQVVQTGERLRVEESELTLGRIFDLNIFRLGGGGSRRVAVLFTDITERKQAEESVRRSEEQLRSVLDGMGEGFALLAPDFTILEHNREALRLDGRPRDEIIGRMHWEVYPGSEDSELGRLYKRAMAGHMPVSLVHNYAWEKGRALWLEMRAYPTEDGSLAVFWRDVTDRREAQDALRTSEEKYRTLFESMDEGFCIIEIVRDEAGAGVDYRLLEANRVFERQTGVVNARGKLASEYVPGEEAFWLENFDRVARTGETARLENYHQPTNHWFTAFIARVGGEGSRRVAIVFDDITERKQRELQQAYLLKLGDAMRPLSDPLDLQRTATSVLGEQLNADRTLYAEIEPGGEQFVIAANHVRGAFPRMIDRFSLNDFGQTPDSQRASGALVLPDIREAGGSDEHLAAYLAAGVQAIISVPLIKQGRWVASLVVHHGSPRRWTPEEVGLVAETAERTWAATQRARADEAVRFSERRFSAVANLVPDLLWESEPDGFTTWYNGRWLEYTGQTFEQATGWGWTDTVHPEDREASTRRYQKAVEKGLPLRQEHRLRRHDGEYRWFAVSTFPIKNELGQVVKMYGAATDIHDLRTLNITLEERVEERTRRLAELNSELAARTRALETFSQLTHTLALETDRYVLIQHVQRVLLSLLPPAHTGYFELEDGLWHMKSEVGDPGSEALRAWLKAGIPPESPGPSVPFLSGRPEYMDVLPPGQDVPAELSSHIRTTAALPVVLSGTSIGVLAVGRFDTQPWQSADKIVLETAVQALVLALERAEALRALAEEREALAAFAHFTERTANTHDVGSLAQQAAEVLRATLNVTSAVYFELRNGGWKALWISGSADSAMEARFYDGIPDSTPSFEQPVTRREPMFLEGWDAFADGLPEGRAYRAVARYPLFPQDHPVGMLGMATTESDTWTDREKAVFRAVGDSFRLAVERLATTQEIERQRQRLADLNAELGSLITRTAHNLEAPARQLGHLLGPDMINGSPALWDQTYDPVALKDEVARLRGVAQDLRQLSVIEEQPLDKEPLSLGELFTEVSTTPPGEQVAWSIKELPIVRGHRALLRQALEVLMTFTLSETRGARYVTVSSRQIEGEVQITVQDDGLGLSGEEAATLFDLAVRTEHAVPVLEGSGLIQVRRILARHGGWAWAESQRSSGKIVLAFPRDEEVTELESLFREDKPGMG